MTTLEKVQPTGIDPSLRPDEKVDARIEEITEWYLDSGPEADFSDKEKLRELIHNAAELFTLATNKPSRLLRFENDSNRFVDHLLNFKWNNITLENQKAALTAGSMVMDAIYGGVMDSKDKEILLVGAQNIFEYLKNFAEIEPHEEVDAGQTKYDAISYLFDAIISHKKLQLETGKITLRDFSDSITDIYGAQARDFQEGMLQDKDNVRDGELYENYVIILGRFVNWSDEKFDEWGIRKATQRQDYVQRRRKEANYKNESIDAVVTEYQTTHSTGVQIKIDSKAKAEEYVEGIVFYNDLAGTPCCKEVMEKSVNSMRAGYSFNELGEQLITNEKLKEEFYHYFRFLKPRQ